MSVQANNIDHLYKRKIFFMTLFNDAIGKGCNLLDKQYITLFQKKTNKETEKQYIHEESFYNIDDLNNYIQNKRFSADTYFSLATTDGNGRATENLKYRYFLAWDFDKKDNPNLDAKDIMFKFKQLGLWYHILVDSGNGYHAYLIIKKTDDLQKVNDITKSIGEKLKADPKAMLQTQVLRVPYTYNLKDMKAKQVSIISMFEKDTVRPYDINKLYKKYYSSSCEEESDKTIQYAIDKMDFPPCIINILNGVEDGDRNFALMRLISFLKLRNISKSESKNIILEWNRKNKPPLSKNETEYYFNYIWDKEYTCFGCITKDSLLQDQIEKHCNKSLCKNKNKEDILFVEGEAIQMEYKICKKLKPQKSDIFQIKGNHLLLISVLKNNPNGLYTDGIIDRLTYKGNCCMSIPTLTKALNELAKNKFIIKISGNKRNGEQNYYKILNIKCEINKFTISYLAVMGVIAKLISPEDFKVYCYLQYRLSKGLNVTQDKLADELGLTQQTISEHIGNLIDAKYLEIKNIDYSNGYGVNIYKVNCLYFFDLK